MAKVKYDLKLWALVIVEFPEAGDSLKMIEENLRKVKWTKIETSSNEVCTVWKKMFIAKDHFRMLKDIPVEFLKCAIDYSVYPKYIVHLGPLEPLSGEFCPESEYTCTDDG